MVIGNYSYSNFQQMNGCTACLVKPNFEPRKCDHGAFGGQLSGNHEAPSVKTLSDEMKSTLKNRLHNGQGNLSLQEWDDFLADLEELGIISHDERFFANGTLHDIPQSALNGGTHFSSGNTARGIGDMWDGDPLKWLNNMDVHMLKNQLYANMNCQYSSGYSSQRDAFRKVAQIVRDILY